MIQPQWAGWHPHIKPMDFSQSVSFPTNTSFSMKKVKHINRDEWLNSENAELCFTGNTKATCELSVLILARESAYISIL